MRNRKYGFIPLKGNRDWAKSVYNVVGTPANFLLDDQGRVMFKTRPYDAETERAVGLEIEALLAAADRAPAPERQKGARPHYKIVR